MQDTYPTPGGLVSRDPTRQARRGGFAGSSSSWRSKMNPRLPDNVATQTNQSINQAPTANMTSRSTSDTAQPRQTNITLRQSSDLDSDTVRSQMDDADTRTSMPLTGSTSQNRTQRTSDGNNSRSNRAQRMSQRRGSSKTKDIKAIGKNWEVSYPEWLSPEVAPRRNPQKKREWEEDELPVAEWSPKLLKNLRVLSEITDLQTARMELSQTVATRRAERSSSAKRVLVKDVEGVISKLSRTESLTPDATQRLQRSGLAVDAAVAGPSRVFDQQDNLSERFSADDAEDLPGAPATPISSRKPPTRSERRQGKQPIKTEPTAGRPSAPPNDISRMEERLLSLEAREDEMIRLRTQELRVQQRMRRQKALLARDKQYWNEVYNHGNTSKDPIDGERL